MVNFISTWIIFLSLFTNNVANQPVTIVPEIPIVMYHEIGNPDGPWEKLYVSKENFSDQIKYLFENGFNTITISDLQANREGKKNLPENPIILTFDDGYSSCYNYIFPLLKENNMTAVFYIYPGKFNKYNSLTEEQIKELADYGIEIGSHSMSHLNMTDFSTKQLIYEIRRSKEILEQITGKKISSFCYPAGRYSKKIIDILIQEGYENAVTTQPGFADPNQNDFELKRIRINFEDSLRTFAKKITR